MLFSVLVSADLRLSQPMVRVVVCCARTACGADKHPAAAPIATMKSRRLISPPKGAGHGTITVQVSILEGADVRVGSKAPDAIRPRRGPMSASLLGHSGASAFRL